MSSDNSLQSVQLVQWLDRIRAGDRGARNELIMAVWGRVQQLTRKMLKGFPSVGRWADTDDVMQNVMLRLLRAIEAVEPGGKREFFGLVAVHIRRELLDLARHYSSLHRQGLAAQGPAPSDNLERLAAAPDASEETAALDTWARFHEEVEKLPAEEREVVGLVFYHGWTQAQVAELFQVTERTVRRWWQSACVRLHGALEGRLPDVGG